MAPHRSSAAKAGRGAGVQAFLDNGDQVTAGGSGTYESSGKHRWRTAGFHPQSDGRELISEGEIDLAARSWAGKLFENN